MVDYNDYEIGDMLPRMNELIQDGCLIYLKWTCPACGERVTSTEANSYQTGGYLHDEKMNDEPCGATYYGTKFNYVMISSTGTERGDEVVKALKKAMEG